MKNLKKATLFVISVFIVTTILAPFAIALDDPDARCGAAVLVETNTGEVFYAKNENERMYPASTTKIMTALLAVEAIEKGEISLTDMVTASETSQYDITADSSNQNIVPGETMKVEDLLYCIMLASANEACNIIGEHVAGGNISEFIAQMNSRAFQLGCRGTHFTNTHGYPDDDHYTTAWDLYLIASEAQKHRIFADICSTVTYTTDATNKAEARTLRNSNRLIASDKDSKYYYEYATGMKTGSTNAAGYCLVSSAEKDGISLIAVVLNAEAVEQEDGSYEIQSFTESKRLFKWAFDNYSFKEILSTTELLASVPVEMGEGTDDVLIRPEQSVTVLLANDVKTEDFRRDVEVFFEDGRTSIDAPVAQKALLGEVTISKDGKVYAKVNLVANNSVALSKVAYMKNQIKAILSSKWFRLLLIAVIFVFVAYVTFVIIYNVRRAKKRRAAEGRSRDTVEQSDQKHGF